jgi:predicted Rossmann fold nucleotide-binding protein DprA/Smf involved in DNA uptake
MKIAVVGSREFKDKEFVKKSVLKFFKSGDIFISGGAKGVDRWAEEAINRFSADFPNSDSIEKKIYLPDWDNLAHPDAVIKTRPDGTKYDAKAGYRRNKLIVDEADVVVAFWDGKSKGTKHSIDLAIEAGKPVDIYVRN